VGIGDLRMKIEKIKVQNFYSFINVELNLGNYSGLTLIKGVNEDTGGSNGSGKSALIEAVYFGLTGKTIRKSTEDTLVNNQKKKKCVVEIQLVHNEQSFKIVRQKKPTKLQFFVGDEPHTQESVAATQQVIDAVLKLNHKVLLASMFFGQSNDLNFLDCTADDKRTIIRNFLNLDDLFEMRDKIKGFKSTYYQNMKQKDAIISETLTNIQKIENKIEETTAAKKKFSKYGSEVLSLSLDDVLGAEKKERQLSALLVDSKRNISELQDQQQGIKYKLDNPHGKKICDKCGQPYKFRKAWVKDDLLLEQEKIEEGIAREKQTIETLSTSSVSLPISSSEFSKVLGYKELCRDETNYETIKAELKDSIGEAQKEKEDFKLQYEVMRFWERAFSEHGVVKYIINNILEYFNERCNYYLSYLTNSKYSVEFDQELVEKIVTKGRLLSYISMSGGEKRKINLAVTLALKDLLLLTDKSHIDLLFFDEVAENIDESGVHGLYQLLQEIKKDKTVFIITHNKHLKTLLDSSKRITIIKTEGTSQIKE
jgi:DNA repair exonuclease SbcCD ATPase subunit